MKNNKVLEFEHDGKIFKVDMSTIKRKQALKLAKLYKKHKDEPEMLASALEDIGLHVEVKQKEKK